MFVLKDERALVNSLVLSEFSKREVEFEGYTVHILLNECKVTVQLDPGWCLDLDSQDIGIAQIEEAVDHISWLNTKQ